MIARIGRSVRLFWPKAAHTTRDHRRGTSDRGAVAIIVAIFLVVAMILLAFVVDRGRVYVARNQLQNAVDAAALAAVQDTCAIPVPKARSVVAATVDRYLTANGVDPASAQIIIQDGLEDEVTGVSVAATQTVSQFFGGFAGVSSATVGARGTALRDCTETYQYVASTIFDVSGTGAGECKAGDPAPCPGQDPGFNGKIYAGDCFEGNGGTFEYVGVSSLPKSDPAYVPPWPCNASWTSPIHNGSVPEATTCDNPASIGTCKFGLNPISLSGAVAKRGYNIANYDATLAASSVSCSPGSALDFTKPIYCNGNLNVPSKTTISQDVVATGNIVLDNDTVLDGSKSILLYSKTGTITIKGDLVPALTTVYAPAQLVTGGGDPQPTIIYNGAGAGLAGTFIAWGIQVNGGGAVGGNGVAIRDPGDWRLSQ